MFVTITGVAKAVFIEICLQRIHYIWAVIFHIRYTVRISIPAGGERSMFFRDGGSLKHT